MGPIIATINTVGLGATVDTHLTILPLLILNSGIILAFVVHLMVW